MSKEESPSGTAQPFTPNNATLTTDSATAHTGMGSAKASGMRRRRYVSRTMQHRSNSSEDDNEGGGDGAKDRRKLRRMTRDDYPDDMVDVVMCGCPNDMKDDKSRTLNSSSAQSGDPSWISSCFSSSSSSSSASNSKSPQNSSDNKRSVHEWKWRPPEMVDPQDCSEEDPVMDTQQHDVGSLTTDAHFYTLTEQIDGQEIHHKFLQMPSAVPQELMDSGRSFASQTKNTFNILMVDGSSSMENFIPKVLTGWNLHVAPALVGRTKIFSFSSNVAFMREGTSKDTEGTKLKDDDFERRTTDLTGALQTIVEEVYKCKEKYVNVLLITDGDHNSSGSQPNSVIDIMEPPRGKVCDVYILGAGRSFPVKYSINIRSRLHSGSSNLPSLFWAQTASDTVEQMIDISQWITGTASVTGKLSVSGTILPGLTPKDTFYLKEWVYFIDTEDQLHEMGLTIGQHSGHMILSPQAIHNDSLNEVFRQWNSIIIQLHNKKERIPADIIPFMERLFSAQMAAVKRSVGNSIRNRLQEKSLKTYETDFRTLVNTIKSILVTDKFQDQSKLAGNILSTTVGGTKYEAKSLQLKGHTDEDYKSACTTFMRVYNANKNRIQGISTSPDECCRGTLSSTVTDLQDPDFSMLMDLNKFEFLKSFTITGIPVFAPVRDSALLNPWSLSIRRLVGAPYTIMSQVAMESFAENIDVEPRNKEIQLKSDDKHTCFNAIVPVFSKDVARILKPIALTELYAMCVTFAILKNPHIVDYNVHMASLGVTWVRILFEFPDQPRPEYVCQRIENIVATAALYTDRPSFAKYAAALRNNTAQALMTESRMEFEGKPLKCETLIKPMFILYLIQQNQDFGQQIDTEGIVKLILSEYIGRCLTNYKVHEKNTKSNTEFFAEDFTDEEKTKTWVRKYVEEAKANVSETAVFHLKEFYSLDKVQKAAKKIASKEVKILREKLMTHIPVKVNKEKIEKLRSVSIAGDVSWSTLKTFVKDIGLSSETISNLFSEEAIFVYTCHALEYRSSRDRLSNPLPDYASAKDLVLKKVESENCRDFSDVLQKEIVLHLQDAWLKEYYAAHDEVVKPMSRTQIMSEAIRLGIEVTEATFNQVYRNYRDHLGLLNNACQCRACPYFLQPNKSYNQHAIVERQGHAAFPHAFHRVAYEHRDSEVSITISNIVNGSHSKSQKTVPQEVVDKYSDELLCLKTMYTEMSLGQ